MRLIDLGEEIFLGVSSNMTRSGLTMLGIVIGIASVIAMMAIGQGSKTQIEANIQSIGSNLLQVSPGSQRAVGAGASAGRGSSQTLTNDDVTAIQLLPGIANVASQVSARYQITAKGTNTNTQVIGTQPTYLPVRNLSIDLGSFLSTTDINTKSKVAVLGPTTRDDLFGAGTDPTGQSIRINGMNFTVVGVTVAKGGSGFSNADDVIYIPLTSMQTFLSGGKYVSAIGIQVQNQSAMTEVQNSVTDLLLQRHKIVSADKADFSILNQADLVSTVSSVTDTFTILLASIAGISLLVGGIGIMNMMLTTVTERTREIGLRLSIGAEKWEIVGQFLGEAVSLTVLGGLIGVLLGYGATFAITYFAKTPTVVSSTSVILAFSVSAVIGVVFGLYPARRAAQLNPIQALRYE